MFVEHKLKSFNLFVLFSKRTFSRQRRLNRKSWKGEKRIEMKQEEKDKILFLYK